MKKQASIIVLIPHYNKPEGLKASLSSINESEEKVDILIVDDGSTKSQFNKEEIIDCYRCGQIRFLDLDSNVGIERALNFGLKEIEKHNYAYIGRLDCGDICKKDKFKKQLQLMNEDPNLYLLGTWVNIIDTKGKHLYNLKHPQTYKEIKKKMYLNSMFVHPTVVFRSQLMQEIGYYPTRFEAAEDYAFFFKVINKFKSENYPEFLLDYVIDEDSISSSKRKIQVKSRIRIILDNFYFGWYPVYGLLRNVSLLFVSRKFTTKLKKLFSKN